MRTMFDSINPFDIPTSAQLVGGYIDGIFGPNHAAFGQPGWDIAGWARFPNAIHVGIAISPSTNAGTVADVERGDMLPWEAPDWVLIRRAAGIDPTVYVNWSNWAPTRTEFQLRGIPEPHWWLASYDGKAEIPTGTVAKQYANSAMSGGHYDLSAVADYWPGIDRPGSTAPTEVIVGGEDLDAHQAALLEDIHAAVSRFDVGFGFATPAGAANPQPNYKGFADTVSADLAGIRTALASLPAGTDLTLLLTKVDRLQAMLDRVFK